MMNFLARSPQKKGMGTTRKNVKVLKNFLNSEKKRADRKRSILVTHKAGSSNCKHMLSRIYTFIAKKDFQSGGDSQKNDNAKGSEETKEQ